MNFLLTQVVLLIVTFKLVKNESLKIEENEVKSHKTSLFVEILSDALNDQRWEVHEKPCLDTMMSILDNAKNFTLWAVWVLDTIQLPTGHLYGQKYHIGNYDECLKPHYGFRVDPNTPKTHYCLAEMQLTTTDKWSKPVDYDWIEHNVTTDVYLKKPTKHGRVLSDLVWGICVPEVCQPSAVTKIARSLLQISHLSVLSESAGINVKHCENVDVLIDSSPGISIFTKAFLLLTTVAVFSTYCVKTGKVTPGTLVGELANSFNLSRNMATLTKVRDDEVYAMNVMRVVFAAVVVFVHYCSNTYPLFIANGLDIEPTREEGLEEELSTSIEVVVDTFLTISGLLFVRGLFSDKLQNPLKFIWKRYIRMIAALFAVMFYMATRHNGDGPVWHYKADTETRICQENWFTNLFMMGNVNAEKMCIITTWYVPCDYQLCLFATILYVIYKKNKTIGKYVFAVSFVAALLTPGFLTFTNGISHSLFQGIESISDIRKHNGYLNFYVKSYFRAGPFLVGSLMGYLMSTYKPKDHRKIIGTYSSYFGLVFGVFLMHRIIVVGHYLYHQGGPLGTAVFAALHRTLWGVMICLIIGISEYGNISFVNSAFSWYPLVPLSRLTYGVYLTHFPIIELIFFTIRTTLKYDKLRMYVFSTGTLVHSYIASLVIWLLIEAPIININNMLLNNTWKFRTEEALKFKNNKKN